MCLSDGTVTGVAVLTSVFSGATGAAFFFVGDAFTLFSVGGDLTSRSGEMVLESTTLVDAEDFCAELGLALTGALIADGVGSALDCTVIGLMADVLSGDLATAPVVADFFKVAFGVTDFLTDVASTSPRLASAMGGVFFVTAFFGVSVCDCRGIAGMSVVDLSSVIIMSHAVELVDLLSVSRFYLFSSATLLTGTAKQSASLTGGR